MRDASIHQPETRALILDRAEQIFRMHGFARTRMGDIAAACEMSPANLYRFFESKIDLSHAITHQILARQLDEARQIVDAAAPAAQRLRQLILTSHRFALEQYLDASRVHDMVTRAMHEQWPVIQAHIEQMRALYRRLIEQGIHAGEFAAAPPDVVSGCVFNACMPFCHPQLVSEQFAEDAGRQVRQMVTFLLRALGVDEAWQ